MMISKYIKKTGLALLSAGLLLSPISVFAATSQDYSSWKSEALQYPQKGQLVPAGPIQITWDALSLNDTNVKQYNVYLDDDQPITVAHNEEKEQSIEIYTTEVKSHQLHISAILDDGSEINTNQRTFYVSKKGVAYENVDDVENLDASWYYNWGTQPTAKKSNLDFVPMIWGHSQNELNNLQNIKTDGYTTVLGFNEPEGTLGGQSNVSVNDAITSLEDFRNSGLRVGSPAVEHISEIADDGSWMNQYMQQVDHDDIDFIAAHEYFYDICGENTKKEAIQFLDSLQTVYELYQKPIWITEIGVVNWDENWPHYSYTNEEGKAEVQGFMDYIVNGVDGYKGLDDLEYVERYAWFPFDTTSTAAGASGLFFTGSDVKQNAQLSLGALTQLGQQYKNYSLADDYQSDIIPDDVYMDDNIVEIEKKVTVYIDENNYEIEMGSVFAQPKDPSKEGYKFVGWYSDDKFINLYDFSQPVCDDLSLYAKFEKLDEPAEFWIVKVGETTYQVEKGTTLSKISDPVKDGYVFKGWYTDADFLHAFNFDKAIDSDIELYAKWEKAAENISDEDNTVTEKKTAVTTSDATQIYVFVMMMVISGGMLFITKRNS